MNWKFFGLLCKSQQDAKFCLFLIRNLFFLWDKNLSHSQLLIKNTYFLLYKIPYHRLLLGHLFIYHLIARPTMGNYYQTFTKAYLSKPWWMSLLIISAISACISRDIKYQNWNSKSHFSTLRNFSSCSALWAFSLFTHSASLGEELLITIVSVTCTISL